MSDEAFSLDMETLSLTPHRNSAVLSVGMVVFDMSKVQTFEEIARDSESIHIVIDTKDQVEKYGRHICEETRAWWLTQPLDAQAAAFTDGISYMSAMLLIHGWMKAHTALNVEQLWSFGAASDAVWLDSAMHAAGVKMPIHYRNVRCLRTMAAELNVECPDAPNAVNHNALHDALVQAMWVQRIQQVKKGIVNAIQKAA